MTTVYTGDEALKTVLERGSSSQVIHLATHGFFLPDQQTETRQPSETRVVRAETSPSALEDPMLRSGLYFAGADRYLGRKSLAPWSR
jgi:hypothetical protein